MISYPILFTRTLLEDYRWAFLARDFEKDLLTSLMRDYSYFDDHKNAMIDMLCERQHIIMKYMNGQCILYDIIKESRQDGFGRDVYSLRGLLFAAPIGRIAFINIPWLINYILQTKEDFFDIIVPKDNDVATEETIHLSFDEVIEKWIQSPNHLIRTNLAVFNSYPTALYITNSKIYNFQSLEDASRSRSNPTFPKVYNQSDIHRGVSQKDSRTLLSDTINADSKSIIITNSPKESNLITHEKDIIEEDPRPKFSFWNNKKPPRVK